MNYRKKVEVRLDIPIKGKLPFNVKFRKQASVQCAAFHRSTPEYIFPAIEEPMFAVAKEHKACKPLR